MKKVVFLLLAFCFGLSIFAADQPLRVAFKTDSPFYQYMEADGTPAGFNIDIIKDIAEKNSCELEFIPMSKLKDCLDALNSGKADVVLGITSYTEGDFASTMETSSSSLCVMARNAYAQAFSAGVNAQTTTSFEFNTANTAIISNFKSSTYFVTGSQKEILENHIHGKGDLLICDKTCMEYLMEEAGIRNQFTVIQDKIDTIGYTMGVKKGNVTLLRLLNEGIMSMKVSGDYDRLLVSWIGENEEQSREHVVQALRVYVVIALILLMVSGVIIFFSRKLSRYLKTEVAEKTGELALRVDELEKERDLRARLIERSPLGMVLLSPDLKVKLMNQSACRLVYLHEAPTDVPVSSLELFGRLYENIQDQPLPVVLKKISIEDSEGTARLYHCSARNIMEGDPSSDILMSVEDITLDEEKRVATIEKEKNRVLNTMMAGMAHEIKNPLTGIMNFAQLIPTCKDDPQFMESFSSMVPVEVDRISRLIENLMQYARPPAGTPSVLDLSSVIQECSYLISALVKESTIRTNIDLETPVLVFADRDQIKQVLINIILNSIYSMKSKLSHSTSGELWLGIRSFNQKAQAVIEISDQGQGMSKAELLQCTEPFYTTKASGTGLGLALSKQYLLENKGSLKMTSEIGRGTTTTITFARYGYETQNSDNR